MMREKRSAVSHKQYHIRAEGEAGVRQVVLTHVEHPAIAYTVEQQKEATSMGR